MREPTKGEQLDWCTKWCVETLLLSSTSYFDCVHTLFSTGSNEFDWRYYREN